MAVLRPPPARPAGLPCPGPAHGHRSHPALVLFDSRHRGEPRGMEHRIERKMLRDAARATASPTRVGANKWRPCAGSPAGADAWPCSIRRMCAVPYVSNVDGGTLELVRSVGVEVVSSAELVQTLRGALDAGSPGTAPGSRPPCRRGARRRLPAHSRTHTQPSPAPGSRGQELRPGGLRQGWDVYKRRAHRGLQRQLFESAL